MGLITSIEKELTPFSFKRLDITPPQDIDITAVWSRKTWNTNRAVVLMPLPEWASPGKFAQQIKFPVGKAIGYFPFFYPLGLQVVLTGEFHMPEQEELQVYVDKIDNQRVILQSIHAINFPANDAVCVRTWGQVITGKFQDAIEKGIANFLS